VEVLELLRHDPELLAIADAVAATDFLDGQRPATAAMPEQDSSAHGQARRLLSD
jgi:hypothetical protein